MAVDFDTVVIGAGVIGLAVARQLARTGQNVLVIETASHAGTETSSRNSEVIHAGLYYPTGSLKARLCLQGRQLLYDFCAAHDVETRKLGKLVVATTKEEEAKLQAVAALASANGVHDLVWMSGNEVATIEPDIRCTRALFSPSSGIVDAAGLMSALQKDAELHGTIFAFNTAFKSAAKTGENFLVRTAEHNGAMSKLTTGQIINCAGHGAHDVAKNVENYPLEFLPPRFLAKGCYCNVSGESPFKHLVYPVPVAGALGIHATFDLSGKIRLGPDIQWIDRLDHSMPDGLPEKFTAAVQTYWPGVSGRNLSPAYCGVRPKIHGPHETFADFKIQHGVEHGVIGLVNMFGIESPGITASLAIAETIANGPGSGSSAASF